MTLSASQVSESLAVYELRPGTKVRVEVLKDLLPDPHTALFFGKLYKLDFRQLSDLLTMLFHTTVIDALLNEGDLHSHDLQDYIIDIVPEAQLMQAGINPASFTAPTTHEFLPELWDMLEVEIAESIQQLVDSLDGVLSVVQGKYGKMFFQTVATLNKQRQGVLGQYKASVQHPIIPNNLVIFDVSGSVTQQTVRKIAGEIVALAYKANASLAIVSNNCYVWDAGTFSVDDVLAKAEYGGTHYETLRSVLDKDWSTVITIADYDSAMSAKRVIAGCKGRIQQLLDISLVDVPTFLAECVGQLADKVTPLLVGNSSTVLGKYDYSY